VLEERHWLISLPLTSTYSQALYCTKIQYHTDGLSLGQVTERRNLQKETLEMSLASLLFLRGSRSKIVQPLKLKRMSYRGFTSSTALETALAIERGMKGTRHLGTSS
jgi:hypothetical protein